MVNKATKYVVSNTRAKSEWEHSVFLNGDIKEKVKEIKLTLGPDLHIWGSSNLVQTLLGADLIDDLFLMIYPLTLGVGKRLFGNGTIPLNFKITESNITPSGVIVVRYERIR